jgi:DNA oxidative demethylase
MRPDQAILPLDLNEERSDDVTLEEGAIVLRGFARAGGAALLEALAGVAREAPFRHLMTPGGWSMSVAMTNCGDVGWVSDRRGYRYDPIDPESGRHWPEMPPIFTDLASRAASAAGFAGFAPDACLLNRYEAGARLSLHQDRNERDFGQPIVSVSLGLPAVFLWGGRTRAVPPKRLPLFHGDVVVWGGPARLTFHGVHPLAPGNHPMTGNVRYNLTLRRAA